MISTFAACAPAPPDERPDVVVLSVDTTRADRMHFLAGLAAGVVFTEATTPLPRTTPALGSLLTGLRPLRHGSREVGDPVDADGRLAGWLADAGWQTVGVSAMRVAGPDQRMDVGFDAFVVAHDARAHEVLGTLVPDAVAALDADRPAFVWVHLADPHFPYLPEGGPDAPACRAAGDEAAAGRLFRPALFANRDGKAAAMLAECEALYDAEVQAVAHAARDLPRLRGRPTWFVLTADHGENLGEGGLFYEHGPDVEDASVRIPLVIAGPGLAPATDVGVARLEDVAPTLLARLGVPGPADLDGADLFGPARAELAFVESGSALQVALFGSLVSGRGDRSCVNEGRFSWCTRRSRPPGLFDHEADPGLERDVQALHPDVAARLRAAADRWPPEHARQRLVRAPGRRLAALPAVEGYVEVGDPGLRTALADWSARLDAAHPAATGDAEALRQLGYVE